MGSLDIKCDNTVHPIGFLRWEVRGLKGTGGWRKRYVSATARMDEDGRIRPLSIQWYDGITYAIDDVRDVRRTSSRKVGGDGVCYTIRIGERITQLYCEDQHWFVEEIVADELATA